MSAQKMSYKAGHKLGLLYKSARTIFERLATKLGIPAKYGTHLFIGFSIIISGLLFSLIAALILMFAMIFLNKKTHSDDSYDSYDSNDFGLNDGYRGDGCYYIGGVRINNDE